jgi:shikimate kinase
VSGRHLILIGYRGTGKTTHGRALAEHLGMPFIDTDCRVVERAGKTIPEIFSEDGEPVFRDLEERVVLELETEQPAVVSTGGGIVVREANRGRLRRAGFVIWLQADDAVVLQRISGDRNRPALTEHDPLAEIRLLQEQRRAWYQQTACLALDTGTVPFAEALERELTGYRAFLASVSG